MKVRWLGHSCIEILGRTHVLIDPDYQREPLSKVKYIFITHGHEDHLGRVGVKGRCLRARLGWVGHSVTGIVGSASGFMVRRPVV